jgi:hypothetical protein
MISGVSVFYGYAIPYLTKMPEFLCYDTETVDYQSCDQDKYCEMREIVLGPLNLAFVDNENEHTMNNWVT